MMRRHRLATVALLALLLAAAAAIAIGWAGARSRPIVARYDLAAPAPHCTGRLVRVAILGDLHVSAGTVPPAAVARIVDQVNGLAPDYVLLVGDYLGHDWPRTPAAIAAAIAPLAGLRPRIGTAAVLGNNDVEDGPEIIAARLAAAGIHVLRNDAWVTPDAAFLGVADITSNTANPVLALERYAAALRRGHRAAPPLLFWLAHQPVMIDRMPTTGTLLVAGHTHGGQILPTLSVPIARWLVRMRRALGEASSWPAQDYVRGLYAKGDKRMLVTSGIGTSGPPFRIGVPPEIALVRVRACAAITPAAPRSSHRAATAPL